MALIVSAQSGNFNATSTWTGGVIPGVGDEAQAANGHTVTITANATCEEVSNAGTGIFTLNSGVTLTANITSKSTTATRNCLQFTAGSPAAASIVGNVTSGSANGSVGVAHTGTGTLTITGNCTGGSNNNATAVSNTSNGLLQITGNAVGGSATINCFGVNNASTGTVTLTGNTTGGPATNSFGANNASTGILTITGIATGGIGSTAAGANNASTGILNLGRAKGNAFGPSNSGGISASVGAANVGLGIIEIQELEYGDFGMSPTSGTGIRLKKVSTNQARFNYVNSGSAKTLVDATQGQMPAASDVRHGISYASGALTGTCRVPAAASVAFGVQVDATTGSAYLSQSDVLAAVWGAATSSLTTAGSIGERLKNAATVATTGEQLATALTAP